jgi:hypothetical protein
MDVVSDRWSAGVGTGVVVLVSLGIGAFVCKVVHESGHALTARAFGSRIESVHMDWPLKFGFFRVAYAQPDRPWQRGLSDLMGTGATSILAYVLVVLVLWLRPALWVRTAVLCVAIVCAWDMFLYATLPLFGLRRGLVMGGRHAEPVEGAAMIGIPPWVFLSGLAVGFIVFHTLLYWAFKARAVQL